MRQTLPVIVALSACVFCTVTSTAEEKLESAILVEVDSSGVPEMKEWTENAVKTAADFYPRIVQELGEEGFTRPEKVRI